MLFHMCWRSLDHINNRMEILWYSPVRSSYHHVVMMRRRAHLVTWLAQGCDRVVCFGFLDECFGCVVRLTGKKLRVGLCEGRCRSWGAGANTKPSAGQTQMEQNRKLNVTGNLPNRKVARYQSVHLGSTSAYESVSLLWCKWKGQLVQWRGKSKTNLKKGNLFLCAGHRQLFSLYPPWQILLLCVLLVSFPQQVAQVVQHCQDGTSIRAVARKFAVYPSTVSREWRRYQETGVCSFVRGGTGGALPKPNKMTSSRLLVCMFLTKLSWGWYEGLISSSGTCAHSPAPCSSMAFVRKHQNWKVCHWHPILFTLSTFDRRERVWRCGSLMVWGVISLVGHKDIHVIANGTLTAVRYWDEILIAIVRPYAGAVGPGFLLVQDNAQPHVARVCRQFLDDRGIDAIDWIRLTISGTLCIGVSFAAK